MTVEMWSGAKSGGQPTGSKIGEVFFANLTNPYIGVLDTGWDASHVLRGWSQWAQISTASGCTGDCHDYCYSGPHIHMAAVNPSCYNSALNCSTSYNVGGNWIYCFG